MVTLSSMKATFRPKLSAGFGFRKETIARRHWNGRDAPKGDLSGTARYLPGSILNSYFPTVFGHAGFEA
jgi:hypothetical protein